MMKALSFIILQIVDFLIVFALCVFILCNAAIFIHLFVDDDFDLIDINKWILFASYTIVTVAIGFWIAWTVL